MMKFIISVFTFSQYLFINMFMFKYKQSFYLMNKLLLIRFDSLKLFFVIKHLIWIYWLNKSNDSFGQIVHDESIL